MPKKTFHLPDEHLDLFEKVKALTSEFDETISGVFVNAMERYVEERSEQLQDVDEYFIWEGTKHDDVEATGRLVRFYGKKIATGTRDEDPGVSYSEILYYTKKKKFLLSRVKSDGGFSETTIEVADTVEELSRNGLLPDVVNQMRTNRVVAEFLDV